MVILVNYCFEKLAFQLLSLKQLNSCKAGSSNRVSMRFHFSRCVLVRSTTRVSLISHLAVLCLCGDTTCRMKLRNEGHGQMLV